MSLNKAVVTGKILEEPETRYTNSDDAVTRLVLQTGENIRLKAACWRALSEQAKELQVDDIVLIVGSVITNSYKTNTGLNRKEFELNVRELYRLPAEPENLNPMANWSANNSEKHSEESQTEAASGKTEDLSDVLLAEEEIPF